MVKSAAKPRADEDSPWKLVLRNRKVWKFTLVKRLYELGYKRSNVLNLFKVIDWIMILPEGLERAFWEELKTYEEEHKMPYITSVEEIGYERGVKEEAERSKEKEQVFISLLLEQKVGPVPQPLLNRIAKLSRQRLEAFAGDILKFESIDDLKAWLKQ
jgi:hypothetical protein